MINSSAIECDLLPMDEYNSIVSEKKKFGRYHKTNFWDVKGYGQKKWVVCIRILPRDSSLFSKLSDAEIVDGCLEYLNTPPPRKKYAKKAPKPKYGKLELYCGKRYIDTGETCLSVLAIVSVRKNKFFWGKGKSV